MDIEKFRLFCLSLPGTTEGMKWDHLCFMIEEKIFVIARLESDHSFVIKCNPEEFNELIQRRGISQAPHMAKGKWINIAGFDVFREEELRERISHSRALVLAGLPKKVQQKYR